MEKLLRQYDSGDQVDSVCVLGSLTVRETRQQKPFLRLELNDSSGRIDAVMWDGFDDETTRMPSGQVIRVRGRMEEYGERPQVVVNSITIPTSGSYDPAALMPASERDPSQMLEELDALITTVENEQIKDLLNTAFSDKEFRLKFSQAPAAKRWHQPYIGGLMEHTLNVAAHAREMAKRYPEVEIDVVLAGALFHDIGKTVEYTWDGYMDNSTEGKLVGHLVIGVELLSGWMAKVKKFPQQLGWHLKHIILSHHGSLEHGSPVPPRTLEALIVHFADDLDSKVSGVQKIRNRQQDTPGDWTEYIRLMETEYFKSNVIENSPSEANENSPPSSARKKPPQTTLPEQEQSLFGGENR